MVKVAGIALAVVSGIYFVRYAHAALAGVDVSSLLATPVAVSTGILTLLYASSIATTTAAWARLLRDMGQSPRFGRLLAILAATQFGKYLPGNVAHHVGRTGLANAAGIPLSAGALSIAYELMLAVVAAAHLGALVLLWNPPHAITRSPMFEHRVPFVIAVTLGAVLAWKAGPRLVEMMWRLRQGAGTAPVAASVQLRARTALFCYGMYATGFCVIGAGLWLVARTLSGDPVPGVLFFMGAFASSWVLGLVAPGAPAGLGVREAVLAIWLGAFLSPPQAVLLVVALRIATTLGDLANFLLGSAALLRYRRG